ncbi:MAG: dipicolinate synthase subunit DpsA [Clostridiaceae bacterium]|nr:dipicolinate synthase subunit DpsA [Clostridiaceae bacterium]
MQKVKNFLIIGGDSRQLYMADYLEEIGYSVQVYGLPEKKRKCAKDLKEAINSADAVLLPLPFTKDEKYVFSIVPMKETIDDIASWIKKDQPVFGGMISRGALKKLVKTGGKVFDYFKCEDVTVMNTVPTVQGILKTMIDNIEYTIHSSECAVFGYGRIAKLTARVLSSIGANVTVCARKYGDIASARINGAEGCLIKDFHNIAHKFDIIINTVPSVVIDRKILENVRADCLIIDVASAPYGTDFAAAFELGLNAVQCSSLPGKVAPKTAGKIIADGVINMLREENYG